MNFTQIFSAVIKPTRHIGFLMWLVAWFFAASCGGQIKNKQELTGSFENWDVKVPVTTEAILPRKEVGQPFVFELKDKSGVPISKLPVDVALIPYEINADKIESATQTNLAELWKAAKGTSEKTETTNSGNAQTDSSDEDLVGRVLKWDTISKDDGTVNVWLKSPAEFNRKVVILLKVGDAGFEYYTFATYATTDYSGGAKLGVHFQKYESCDADAAILSENIGLTANVGECFAVFIKVLEASPQENIYTSFNGSINILSEASPQTSWAEVAPIFLRPKFTCQFVNGVCIAPIRARLSTVQEFPLTVRFENENQAPVKYEGIVTTSSDGKKHSLVLKTNPGPPTGESDKPIYKIDSSAGTTNKLSAVWVDAGGNFVSNATEVVWDIPDNADLELGLPTNNTSNSLNFTPTKTGKGFLTLSSEEKSELKPIVVEVPSGPFVKWGVRINKSVEQNAANAITAGKCVDVDLFASDAFDNVNSTITATNVGLVLRILDSESGPVVADRAHFEGTTLNQRQINNITIKDGEATGIERLCLYDATAVSPKIRVEPAPGATQFSTVEGESQTVHMIKGSAARLALFYPNADPNEIRHACAEFKPENLTNPLKPCIVESLNPSEILSLRAGVLDSAGNFLNYVPSVWQQVNELNDARGTSDPKFILNSTPSGADNALALDQNTPLPLKRSIPSKSGDYLKGTSSEVAGSIKYSFEIISNVVDRAVATPCVGTECLSRETGVFSTDKFGVRLTFKDANDNAVNAAVGTDSNNYKVKIPFSEIKPAGQLVVNLEAATGSKPHALNPNTAFDCPHNGNGQYIVSTTTSTCTRDTSPSGPKFSSILDANNTFKIDSNSLLVPPTASLYFQAQGRHSTIKPNITGEIINFTLPGLFVASLPVESDEIEVLPGSPYFFEVRDTQEALIPFADPTNASQRLVIQSNTTITTGKTLSVIGYDFYGNKIGPLLTDVKWDPLAGEAATCDSLTNGLVNTTNSTRADATDRKLENVDSFILNSPCDLKGKITISPVVPATGSTVHTSFVSKPLINVEFIGSVASKFSVEAIPITAADPYIAAPFTASNKIEAGEEFYLRIIPLTADNSIASSYQGQQLLSLSSPIYTAWSSTVASKLPQTTGEPARCEFIEQADGYYVHALNTNKNDVPVCIIKGRQSLSTNCISPLLLTGLPEVSGNKVCSENGFVSQAVTGTSATLIHVTDLSPTTTIANEDLNNNRLKVEVEAGPPAKLQLANKCGGPTAGAVPWDKYQMGLFGVSKTVRSHIDNTLANDKEFYEITTDDSIQLVPVLSDSSGNYISDVSLNGSLPTISSGVKTPAGGGTPVSLTQVLSLTGSPATVSSSDVASGSTSGCAAHTLITINPRLISDVVSLKALGTAALKKENFDKIQVSHSIAAATFSTAVTIAVNSGRPAQATVETSRVDLSSATLEPQAHALDGANKYLSPGDCARISISATDQYLNPVVSFDETVDVDIRVKNYIAKTATETFFQPGGLYEGVTIGGKLRLIPRYKSNPTYIVSDPTLNWNTGAEHTPTDFTDPDQNVVFVGHERLENKGFSSGKVADLNRYMCVFDASPAGQPQIEVKIDALQGSSTAFVMQSHAQASLIDVQDNSGHRLCRLPTTSDAGVKIPRMTNVGGSISFTFDTSANAVSCLPVEVTNAPQIFKFKPIDGVGNEVSGYTLSSPTLTSPVSSVTTAFSNPTLTLTTETSTAYTRTDTIAGSVSATTAGHTVNQSFSLNALAKRPATFDFVTSNNNIESVDNAFHLIFTAKDQFDNFINDPDFSWTMSLPTITYTGTPATNLTNGPNNDTASQGLAPSEITTPLTFNFVGGKWIATTAAPTPSGAFHFKRNAVGGVTVHATALFAKGMDTQGSTPKSNIVTINSGVTAATVITEDDGQTPLVEWNPDSPNTNAKPVVASSSPYYYKTLSFDAYGNTVPTNASVSPTCKVFGENRDTGTNSDVVSCSPDPLSPGRISVSVLKAGEFQFGASRGAVLTPLYKVRFNPAGATAIKLTRTDNAGVVLASPPAVTAGETIYFKLDLVDAFDNIMSGTTEDRNVVWSVSENYPDISEGGEKVQLPATSVCTFTLGRCPTVYSVTPKGSAQTNGKLLVSTTNTTGGVAQKDGQYTVLVNPAAVHHMRVIPQFTTSGMVLNNEARRDNSTKAKFSVSVTAHDQFGNLITPDNALASRKINLKIERADGSATNHPDGNGLIRWGSETNTNETAATSSTTYRVSNTAYFFTVGNTTLTVDNLAYDENGTFRIIATDADDSSFTTPEASSSIFTLKPSTHSLKDFLINTPVNSTIIAGVETILPVVARGWYDVPLRGFDAQLSNVDLFTFTWNGSLPQTNSTLPTTFNFLDGVANVTVRIERVEPSGTDLTREIKSILNFSTTSDGKSFSSVQPAATASIILSPAALNKYVIEAKQGSTVLDGATLIAKPAEKFAVTVTAYDEFGNKRQGEAGLNLVAEKHTDTKVGSALPVTTLRSYNGNTFVSGLKTNFSPSNLDLTTGTTTLSDASYLVPQTVRFTLAGTNTTVDKSGYIQFDPHIDTVKSYSIAITETTDITNTGQLRTHGQTAVQIVARDIDGNPVPNIDTVLNGQNYTFSGADLNGATTADVYPTTNSFDATGVWTTSINFQATQSFSINTLSIADNHAVSGDSDVRTGSNTAAFSVYSRFDKYILDPGGTAVEWFAGSPAQLKVVAVALDGLPVREFDAVLNGMDHVWSGLENSPSGVQPKFANATATNPNLTFENGIAFIDITPSKKAELTQNDASKLSLTDNFNSKVAGAGNRTGTLKNTVQVRSGLLYNYTVSRSDDTRSADSNATTGLFSLTITPKDQLGNPTKGEVAASLVATHLDANGNEDTTKAKSKLRSTTMGFNADSIDLLNGLDAATGSKTFADLYYPVAFNNVQFKVVGQDTTVNAQSLASEDINFTPTANTISSFTVTPSTTSPTAGTEFTVTVTGNDVAGNQVTGLSDSEANILRAMNFKLFGPANAPNGTAPSPAVNTVFQLSNFTNDSVATLGLTFRKTETIPVSGFRIEDSATPVRSGTNTADWIVSHGAATTLTTNPQPDKKAGEEFTINALLKDSFGNPAACSEANQGMYAEAEFKGSDNNFSNATTSLGGFSGTIQSSPVFVDANDSAVSSAQPIIPSAAESYQMTLKATLYKKGVNRLTLKACNAALTNNSIVMNITESDTVKIARISTESIRPANGAAQIGEIECRHSGSNLASADVYCPQVYSYFWDEYGNTFANGTGLCTWNVTKAHNDHDFIPPSIDSTSSSTVTPTRAGPINAKLKCTSSVDSNVTAEALLYGGISKWALTVKPNSSQTVTGDHTTTAYDLDGKEVTVGTPMVIAEVKAYMVKNNQVDLPYQTSSETSHQITIDKSSFTGVSAAGVTNIPSAVTANLINNTGVIDSSELYNLPFNGSYTDRALTLTLRGIAYTISNIDVNTGIASSIAFGTAVSAVPNVGTQITEVIHLKDSAGNFANCSSLLVSVVGGGEHDAPANGSSVPGQTADFVYDTATPITAASVGVFNVNITFYRVENISLEFKTLTSAECGPELALQKTYTPAIDQSAMHARLSSFASPTYDATDAKKATTTHTEFPECSMGAGLNVSCSTAYVHVWDKYGNYVENAACDSWSWHDYDGDSSDGVGAKPDLTNSTNTRSVSLSGFTDFVDGRLSCTRGSTTIHRNGVANGDTDSTGIHTLVHGGLSSIELTTVPSPDNTSGSVKTFDSLTADNENLKVTQIAAKMRKKNVPVAKDDFNLASPETISLSTVGTGSRTLTSGAHPIIASTTVDCKFDANGICKAADGTTTQQVNLNFKIVEGAARTVTFDMRTRQASMIVSAVTPNVAASATVDVKQSATSVTSVVAGSTFNIETTVKDAFGNLTDAMSNNLANTCAVDNVSETGNSLDSADTYTATGLYTHTAETITSAGAKTLSIEACGLSAVTRSLTVTPAALHEIRITDGMALPTQTLEHKQCSLAATGSGANCGTIRAFFLDVHGNERADICTTWTWTDNRKSKDVYSDMMAPSLSITANSANTTVTHSDFFDGVLACTTGSKTEMIDLYGGIGKVVIANEGALNKVVTAGETFSILADQIKILSPARSASTTGSRVPAAAADENLIEISDVGFPDSNSQLVTISAPATIDGSTLPAPTNCNFGASGKKGICSTNTYSTTLTKANSTGLTLRVSVRGKSVDIGGITVVPANAESISGVAFIGNTYSADNEIDELSTDDTFRVRLTVRDAYGNPTNRSHNTDSCTLDVTNVTIDTAGVAVSPMAGKTSNTSLEPTAAADRVLLKAGAVGVYETHELKQLRLIASGANGAPASSTLKYNLCGRTHTAGITLQVKSGVPNEVFLRTDTNAQRASSATEVECKLNPAGAGATCPTVTAFFYDKYENRVTGSNAVCDTWTMNKTNASNAFALPTVGELVPAANENSKDIPTASATQSFVTSGPLNLTLKCNRADSKGANFDTNANLAANKLQLFGGISALDVTHGDKTIDAAPDNFSISAIKYMTQKGNAQEVMSTTAMSAITANDTIFFTTDASAGATGVQPIANASVSCNFRTNGTCSTTHNFTFNKAELDKRLSVNVRGVNFDITDIDVSPGAVDNTKTIVSNLPTTTTAGTTITGVTVELFDQYNNRTSKSCDANNEFTSVAFTLADAINTALDGGNSHSPNGTAPTLPGASEIAKNDANTVGKFTFGNIRFTKANEYRIKGNACGVEVINRDVTVTSGATASIKIFKTVPANPFSDTPEANVECPHSGTGAAVACPTLTATFFDELGNQMIGDAAKCTNGWSFTGASDTTTPSIGTGATPNLVNITAADYIDGTVKCTSGAFEGAMPIFGGTKEVELVVSTTAPTAGLNNVTLNHVIVKQRKGNDTVAVSAERANETVSLSTTATKGELANNDVLPENTITCSVAANDSGKCTPTSTKQFNFTRAEAKALTASIRGKAHSVTITTTAAAAESAELEQVTAGNKTAGTSFDMTFKAVDIYGNPTTNACSSIAGSGGLAAPNGGAPIFGSPNSTNAVYTPPVTLKASGSNTVTYTCSGGKSASAVVIVDSSGTRGGFILTNVNERPAYTATPVALSLGCPLDSGDAAGNVTCPTIHAFAYDNYGNSYLNSTCTWKLTKPDSSDLQTTASSLSGSTFVTAAAASSTTLKRSKPIDVKVECTEGNAFNAAHPILYGGITDIELTVPVDHTISEANKATDNLSWVEKTYTHNNSVKVENKNVIISGIKAHSKKNGANIEVPGIANQPINIAVAVANVANVGNDVVFNPTPSCSFNSANSTCSAPLEFTFKKVHPTAGTRPLITITMKNRVAKVSVGEIVAGNGVTLTHSLANTYAVTGNTIAFETQVNDQFGNVTDLSPSGTACAAYLAVIGIQPSVFYEKNPIAANDDRVANKAKVAGVPGKYSADLKFLTTGNNDVNVSACGLGFSKTVAITAGAAKRVVVTNKIPTATEATGTAFYRKEAKACADSQATTACQLLNPRKFDANDTAETPSLYVWKFDIGGNILTTQDGTCKMNDGDTDPFTAITLVDDAGAQTPAGSTVVRVNITQATVGPFANVSGFKVKSNATTPQYHWTTAQCTRNEFSTKTNLNFKQPVLKSPDFKCFPFGQTKNDSVEALCTIMNNTTHTIQSIGITKCTANTGNCATATIDNTNDKDFSTTFASHCQFLPAHKTDTPNNSSRCSAYIEKTTNGYTKPFYFTFTSSDPEKVMFKDTAVARIPNDWGNTDACGQTGIPYYIAAGCDLNKAHNFNTNAKGYAVSSRIIEPSGNCNGDNNKKITVTFDPKNTPRQLDSVLATAAQFLDTTDGVTVHTSDCAGKSNESCDITFEFTRSSSETVIKLVGSSAANTYTYFVRTTIAPTCAADQ